MTVSSTPPYTERGQWRLALHGVDVALIERSGVFGALDEQSSATEKYLLESTRLLEFVSRAFPPPVVRGNRITPRTTFMPGLPFLRTKRIVWKAHVPGKPIDPFSTDLAAHVGDLSETYGDVVEVEVQYQSSTITEDDDDPRTFLEISANTTGEFIHGGALKCFWANNRTSSQVSAVPNKRISVPVTLTVPETEWTLRWPLVSSEFFENTLIGRLRSVLGKVNSSSFSILFDAAPETVMFVGFDYRERQSFTGTESATLVSTRFVEVTMKFLEKHVEDQAGRIRGHNDFWEPGIGWRYLLCGTKVGQLQPIYARTDLNAIFLAGHGTCDFVFDEEENRFERFADNCLDGFQCPAPPPTFPGLEAGDIVTRACLPP